MTTCTVDSVGPYRLTIRLTPALSKSATWACETGSPPKKILTPLNSADLNKGNTLGGSCISVTRASLIQLPKSASSLICKSFAITTAPPEVKGEKPQPQIKSIEPKPSELPQPKPEVKPTKTPEPPKEEPKPTELPQPKPEDKPVQNPEDEEDNNLQENLKRIKSLMLL